MKNFKKVIAAAIVLLMAFSSLASAYDITWTNKEDTLFIPAENVNMEPGQDVAKSGQGFLYYPDFQYTAGAVFYEDPNNNTPTYAQNALIENPPVAACAAGTWNWMYVLDLGSVKTINRIAVTFAEGSYPVNFDVAISADEASLINDERPEDITIVKHVENNEVSGLHEFNIQPSKARFVLIRDNVAQVGVRQMGISHLEVNEVPEFYKAEENGEFTPAYDIKEGTVCRMIFNQPELAGKKVMSALYEKSTGKLVSVSQIQEVCPDGQATVAINVDKAGTETVDYSRQDASTWMTGYQGDNEVELIPTNIILAGYDGYHNGMSVAEADQVFTDYHPIISAFRKGNKPYPFYAYYAIDADKDSHAVAGGIWNWIFNIDFGEDKTVGAVDISFVENSYPTDFDIVAIAADGTQKTVVSVSGNDRGGDFSFEFDPVQAKTIKVIDRVAQVGVRQMAISDFHAYNHKSDYEIRSFIWDGVDNLIPFGSASLLK